jgi:hypothetical protein
MSLIHGSTGIIYFAHQFKPKFIEAGLLADVEMTQAVKEINRQILKLAPILNSPTVYRRDAVTTDGSDEILVSPLALMVKVYGETAYIFSVNVEDKPLKMKLTIEGIPSGYIAEVYGENRSITPESSTIEDNFTGLEVHIYRLTGKRRDNG